MADYLQKTFSTYMVNFQENYRYFTAAYKGKYLELYLDQFVNDQINMTQSVYGDQCAEAIKELAQKISPFPKHNLN